MTEVLVRLDVLEPYAVGTGAQLVSIGEQPFGDAIAQIPGSRIECSDASLDYVLADTSCLPSDSIKKTLAEWHRCLRNGGRLAIIAEPHSVEMLERLLALDVGAFVDEKKHLDDGRTLLLALRDFDRSVRRHFARILDEISWEGRPSTWRDELRFDVASLMLHTGEGRLAAEFYRGVLKDDPDSTDARVGLALSLALLQDWNEAKEILSTVLEVDPNHGLAAAWLKRVHAQVESTPDDPTVLEPAARRSR